MKLANKDKMKPADMEKSRDSADGTLTSISLEGMSILIKLCCMHQTVLLCY